MIELTINLLVVRVNKCLLEYLKLLSYPVIFPLLTKVSVLSCANLYALDNAITSTICSKSWLLLDFICGFASIPQKKLQYFCQFTHIMLYKAR